MASLTQILQEKNALEERLMAQDGELTELDELQLTDLDLKLPEKIDGWYLWLESVEAEADRLQARADRIKSLVATLENLHARSKEHIKGLMLANGHAALDGQYYAFKLAKTAGYVVINNEDLIPKEYKKEVITVSIDRVRIKQDLSLGVPVEGARLQEGFSLRTGVVKKLKGKK